MDHKRIQTSTSSLEQNATLSEHASGMNGQSNGPVSFSSSTQQYSISIGKHDSTEKVAKTVQHIIVPSIGAMSLPSPLASPLATAPGGTKQSPMPSPKYPMLAVPPMFGSPAQPLPQVTPNSANAGAPSGLRALLHNATATATANAAAALALTSQGGMTSGSPPDGQIRTERSPMQVPSEPPSLLRRASIAVTAPIPMPTQDAMSPPGSPNMNSARLRDRRASYPAVKRDMPFYMCSDHPF